MQMSWRSTITAGIMASIVVALFMVLVPQIIGMGAIDITRDLGMAFSATSPYVAGAIFLAVLGIIWATIFRVVYNGLPGSYITKGIIYGAIVGMFSMAVLPNIMTTLDSVFGPPNEYSVVQLSLGRESIVTIIAYVLFGITLAITSKPAESRGNI